MVKHRYSRRLHVEVLESRRLLTASCADGLASSGFLPAADSRLIGRPEEVAPQSVPRADGPSSLDFSALDAAGNSRSRALPVGVLEGTQTFRDFVGWTDRRDFYRFELRQSGEAELTVDQLTGDLDLYVYNESGRRVARSAQWGRRDEHLTLNLAAGTYYALVAPYRWSQSGYRLMLSGDEPAAPPDRAGDTRATAGDLGDVGQPRTVSDYVGVEDESDVYRIQVSQRSTVAIGLTQLAADADLSLHDSAGRLLARSDNPATQQERLTRSLGSGTYYVRVASYQFASTNYQLRVVANSPEQQPDQQPGDGSDADPAANPVNSPLSPPNDVPVGAPNGASGVVALAAVPYVGGGNDWNVNSVDAPEAWSAGYQGQGVVVAVIDTGVDRNHADLSSNIWVNPGEIAGDGRDNDGNGYVDDVYGWNFADNNSNTSDRNGHGTHVAGSIAAVRNGFGATGVAPRAQVMPVRVLGASGSGSAGAVAAGIRYAADNGADVINLSLGGSYSGAIRNAVQYAIQRGALVVAAAGNSGRATPTYPARFSDSLDVLSVGAHDRTDRRAGFSNRVGNSGAVQVDAPGVSVYSTYPGSRYTRLNGTSMAAPHAAGVAALVLSAAPNLLPSQLRTALVNSTTQAIVGSDSSGAVSAALAVPWGIWIAAGGSPTASVAAATGSSDGAAVGMTAIDVGPEPVAAGFVPFVFGVGTTTSVAPQSAEPTVTELPALATASPYGRSNPPRPAADARLRGEEISTPAAARDRFFEQWFEHAQAVE